MIFEVYRSELIVLKPTKYFNFLLIIVIASLLFAVNQFVFNGTIESANTLAQELQTTAESLDSWQLIQKAPFKYRVLFPTIVNSTYQALLKAGLLTSEDFYYVYLIISCLCMIAASLGIWALLNAVIRNRSYAKIGMLFYFISVPFLFAYTLPVHTREDFLAFAFFNWGLWALIRKKYLLLVILATLGALTRETLLLLPFLALFYGHGTIFKRGLSALIPIASWLVLRLYMGEEAYNRWEGLEWNIINIEQVIVFGYLAFSFLWLPTLISYKENLSRFFISQKAFRIFGRPAFLSSFILVFFTTFIFGIFNEIRLLFLLAPFMIVYALGYFEHFSDELSTFFLARGRMVISILLLIFILFISYFAEDIANSIYPENKYGIAYDQWLIVTLIFFYPTILLIAFEIYRKPQSL